MVVTDDGVHPVIAIHRECCPTMVIDAFTERLDRPELTGVRIVRAQADFGGISGFRGGIEPTHIQRIGRPDELAAHVVASGAVGSVRRD